MAESFGALEIAEFLRLLDAELDGNPRSVIVIGGAAIALLYVKGRSTRDVDFVNRGDGVFWAAVERARSRMASPLPVQTAGVFQPPYDYEERCQPVELEGGTTLKVWVPERHDLALMKIARGEGPDLDAVVEMHGVDPFDLEVLVLRYHATRIQFIGSPEDLRDHFLEAIRRTFGEARARRVGKRLETEKAPFLVP